MEQAQHDIGERMVSPAPPSEAAHLMLRAATRADHDAVDAIFAGFGMDRDGYARMLTAHARILPRAEALTRAAERIPGWQGRSAAIAADLAALGIAMPAPVAFDLPAGDGAAWGALYVVEGSRLGGVMIARGVPAGLPIAYLSAGHAPGGWRATLAAIDCADRGDAWRDMAVAGAKATFAAYARAAQTEGSA